MAIEQQKPPALKATLTMTPQELEERLRAMWRLGFAKGIQEANKDQIHNQQIMPTCPTHPKVPLWLESHATADGGWLYCPFCRQDAKSSEHRHTDSLRKIHLEKHRE